MNILKIIKDIDIWKILLMILIVLLLFMWGGYTIRTKWGTVAKDDLAKREMVKVKTQTNYSKDMKTSMIFDLSECYEYNLKKYIKENNINISYKRIEQDIKYYKLITIAMSDACEDITIDRYIHNNDLYRYQNRNDWDNFKLNVVNLYLRVGRDIIMNYYDDAKTIMPLREWEKRAGKEIMSIITINTNKLLEDLKTESCIYYYQRNGHG